MPMPTRAMNAISSEIFTAFAKARSRSRARRALHAAKALEAPVNITLVLLPPYPRINPIEKSGLSGAKPASPSPSFEAYQEIVTQWLRRIGNFFANGHRRSSNPIH